MSKEKVKTEFIDVLMRQGDGDTNQELSDALRDVTKRVTATGKAGTITLTLKVSQMKKTGQILIEDSIKTRLPQYDRPAGIAFADEDGNLLRDNPNVRPLFEDITDVGQPTTEVIEIDGEEKVVDLATGEVRD